MQIILEEEDQEAKVKLVINYISYIKLEILHKKTQISENKHFYKLLQSLLEEESFEIIRYIMKEYQDIAVESAKVLADLVNNEEFDLNIIYDFLNMMPVPTKIKDNVFYPEIAPINSHSKKRKRQENFDPEQIGQRLLVDTES